MRVRFWAALLSSGVVCGAAAADETAAVPKVPPVAPTSTVRLQAVIAAGAKPMREAIAWTVSRLDGGVGPQAVATQSAAAPQLDLAPGRYAVTARYGDAEVRDEIVVGAAETAHVVNLDAGHVRFGMIPYAGAPVIADDVTWEVYRYTKSGPSERNRVAVVVAPVHQFVLPAGHYLVRARYDASTADLVVPVIAGHSYKYTVNLYAGKVALSAVADPGAAIVGDVAWEIRRAKPNAAGEREVIAARVGSTGPLLLREGRYVAMARADGLAGETPFEVKAGNSQKIKVVLRPVEAVIPAAGG